MLHNKSQMVNAIKNVAKALADLNDKCIYVGGAVTGFYANDPLAPEVRPTKDIDIVLEITSLLKLEELRQKLAELGIHVDSEEKVLCRFKYQNILIDVLSTKEVGWAPANPWFKAGMDNAEIHLLDDIRIKLMPLAYFLASKFAAFKDRGKDARTSRDFEDIVYLLDNRLNLVRDIVNSPDKVRQFLINEFRKIIENPDFHEAISGHLEPVTKNERFDMIIKNLTEIAR